jgi:hypothetical protein
VLDKTKKEPEDEVVLRPVDKEAPAIFVRMSSQVGQNRTMEMSFGIPLDMTPSDLNKYIDKVSACAERQNEKGILEVLKFNLRDAYKRIEENTQHIAGYEAKHMAQWEASGRRGDWQPSGAQSAEIRNFQTTISDLRDNVIPRLKKQIAESEAKISEGD